MTCRGIRGAVCVEGNDPDAIIGATRRLLESIVAANGVPEEDVASVIFTTTGDLDTAYPARAAREMGWTEVPLLCMQEMEVTNSLSHCVRVLIHWNTNHAQDEIQHVYLGAAQALRPDLGPKVLMEEE